MLRLHSGARLTPARPKSIATPSKNPRLIGRCWQTTVSTSSHLQAAAYIDPAQHHKPWLPTIGLELHVQLKSTVKLFSSAPTSYDEIPNSRVAFYDASLPGTLPVLNPEPVQLAIRAALAFGCCVNESSRFDRKHYFYADLPTGFQITQKYSALASNGRIGLTPKHDGVLQASDVRLSQVQLEQDTAKSSHDPSTATTLIDLNRAGTALIEIISEPDMHSTMEAAAYVRKVQQLLRCTGASDANMEKGSMRIDVNISVARDGEGLGTRCEIKNLNSIRSMTDAIDYEVIRQSRILEEGRGPVEQQTRGYDAVTQRTHLLRSKADAPDYRYMPDPELAPLIVPELVLKDLRANLPELPDAARDRLQDQYGLSARDANIIVRLGMGDAAEQLDVYAAGIKYFELVADGRSAKVAANWLINKLVAQLAKHDTSITSSPVAASDLGQLIDAVQNGSITGTTGKLLLAGTFDSSTQPLQARLKIAIQAACGEVDSDELAQKVIDSLPVEAEKVRKGNTRVIARLVGEAMKLSKGKARAQEVQMALQRALLPSGRA